MLDLLLEITKSKEALIAAINTTDKEMKLFPSTSIKFLELSIVRRYLMVKLEDVNLDDVINGIESDLSLKQERLRIQSDINLLKFLRSERSLDASLNSVTLLKEDQWDENP